jgi:hypothetical protein
VALPHNIYWSPARRSLVRVNPGLVAAADRSRYYPKSGWHSSDEVVDCQKFIIAGGSELYLIAGLLGLGIGYLLTHHSRLPRETEPVRVFPLEGRPFTGPWRGMADNGDLLVGNRQFDHDQLVMAGPVRTLRESGRQFVDLNKGWVDPDELALLQKAHDRNGYARRKGGKK